VLLPSWSRYCAGFCTPVTPLWSLDISFPDGHTRTMTKLLEKAIAQARSLPPEEQDTLAAVLLAMTDEGTGSVPLDDDTRAAIREGLAQARRGEFASDAEVEALWKRFDL
jgi:predicted transcriptional regulator